MTQTTNPMMARLFGVDEPTLARFRDNLSSEDKQVLDSLFDSAQVYNLAAAQAKYDLPMELILLAMLIEHQKTLRFLVDRLNYYDEKLYLKRVKRQQGII